MSSIPKLYVTLFFVVFFTFLGLSVCQVSLQGFRAEQYAASWASLVSEYGMSAAILSDAKEDAEKNGYELNYQCVDRNQDGQTDMVDMKYSYCYEIPMIGLINQKGYAQVLAR